MTIYNRHTSGLWIPKEKLQLKREKPEYLKEWDCPSCGEHYDTRLQENEEYTVGRLGPEPWIPHIICPACGECMGCSTQRK